MLKSRSVITALLLLALLIDVRGCVVVSGSGPVLPGRSRGRGSTEVQVALSAAHRTVSWDDRDPDRVRFELPLLYLHREREAAAESQRTLVLAFSGLGGGIETEVELLSRHVDVSTGERHRETRAYTLPDRPCTADDPCVLRWTLDARTMLSDFYDLHVRDRAGGTLWESPHPDRPDFVALDTWDVAIGEYTVRVTYASLFPFAGGLYDLDNRLPPGAVTDFVERQFASIIRDTWNTHFHAWGFDPIHPEWDADKVVEVYITDPPFALFDGTGTYTVGTYADGTPYPQRRLWWYASDNTLQGYDSLENGVKAVFSHEFFHMVQWNVLLSAGCSAHRWKNVFIEAQGKLAPSVQYPELEMLRGHFVSQESQYVGAANRFLKHRLKASFADLEADSIHRYDAALYWRFLYEQFGGMGIVRAALEEMACGAHPDIETSLNGVMDAALARYDGPFESFEESLVAFARANYALRLANGRCTTENPEGCQGQYHDPHYLYTAPPLETVLDYEEQRMTYEGSIPSTYGTALIEVRLATGKGDRSVRLALRGEGASFIVQVWRLRGGRAGPADITQVWAAGSGSTQPSALSPVPETRLEARGTRGAEVVLSLDVRECDRLALIVTRLSGGEGANPAGRYVLTLDPA